MAILNKGAVWLSQEARLEMVGLRVRASLEACGLEPHQRLCFVPSIKTLYPLLSTGSTNEDPSRHD